MDKKLIKKRKKVALGIFIFLFIYMPPLTSINTIHIISPIAYIILFFRYRTCTLKLLRNKGISLFILGVLSSIILAALSILITTRDFTYIKNYIYIPIEVIPCVLLITILFEKNRFDLKDIFHILLNVALIQSLISILTFINPEIRGWILNKFYYEEYVIGKYAGLTLNRIYGFTYGFTYAMPVVQSFMAVIAFIYSINKSVKYSLYIPPLLFSAAINARVGIIIFIIGIIVVILLGFIRSNVNKVTRLFTVILIFIICSPLLLNFIESKSEYTAKWIRDAYSETQSFIIGRSEGYYSAMSNMKVMPNIKGVLIGTGEDRFDKVGVSSDIGYVNDLFLGGIFFVMLLYSSFLRLFSYPIKYIKQEYKVIPLLIIILILVLNVKGFAFKFNNFNNLFILIIFALINDGIINKCRYLNKGGV